MKVLFDSNILIDYLLGIEEARKELELYNEHYISVITKMEILVGTSKVNEEITREFLSSFTIIDLTQEIAEIAIGIRKKTKIKLPDAIIWATAKSFNGLLITRNIKDFSSQAADIKIPYQI
jgi:predicted nucleic acid-binding protein